MLQSVDREINARLDCNNHALFEVAALRIRRRAAGLGVIYWYMEILRVKRRCLILC